MRDFIALFAELDATSRTSVKLDALKRYFDRAPADDGAWAVYMLTGRRMKMASREKPGTSNQQSACQSPASTHFHLFPFIVVIEAGMPDFGHQMFIGAYCY